MAFLSPLFFLGLAALAVPVLVHLIQRERKRVIEFPSLMFVQKIPYQSVRRRRIRHWALLLMRAAAMILIIMAFARPFLPQGAAAMAAAGGSRDIVILLDNSASMGYGDNWQRARDAAHSAIRNMGPTDRGTLVLFGRNAEEQIRATSDRGRLEAAVNAATLTAGATRFGPALKLAESILAQSNGQRREAILISDFQKSGWSGAEDVRFAENMTLTTVPITTENPANVSVPSITFARAPFSGQERITLTAGVANRGAEPVTGVPVTIEIDGHQLESVPASIGANASASVAFQPFTLANNPIRGVVRAGSDPLAADNAFHFVIAPSAPVSVLVVDGGDRGDANFFLTRALGIGNTPSIEVEVVPAARVSAGMLESKSVVILNNTPLPPALGLESLRAFVERGGGLLVVMGERTTFPGQGSQGGQGGQGSQAGQTPTGILPGTLGGVVDRATGRGATIGNLDYSHPVFEVFKAPRSGDFSAAKVFRSRELDVAPTDRVLARYDDGTVVAAERRTGNGRVIAFTTTLDDSWNDLPRRPVYLPLVHQLTRYLAQYDSPTAWRTVGQVLDMPARVKTGGDRVVVTPAGERKNVAVADAAPIELTEQGVYEIRRTADPNGRPDMVAVNLDPTESDLAPMDPTELVAAVTGRAGEAAAQAAVVPAEVSAVDAEKQQGLWWYLLIAGLLLLAAETAVANHLSQKERFL